jgi:hypothetical protein
MRPTKPDRVSDAFEPDPQPTERLGLALECVRVREGDRLHSVLVGADALSQCTRDIDQALSGETLFFGHVRGATRHCVLSGKAGLAATVLSGQPNPKARYDYVPHYCRDGRRFAIA